MLNSPASVSVPAPPANSLRPSGRVVCSSSPQPQPGRPVVSQPSLQLQRPNDDDDDSTTTTTTPRPLLPSRPQTAALNTRHHSSRPLSVGDLTLDENPTSLQRHFRHQRNQSSTEPRSSSTLFTSPTVDQTRRLRPRSIEMPLTGDNRAGRSPETTPKGILGGWLPGSAASPSDIDASSPSSGRRKTQNGTHQLPLHSRNVTPSNTSRFGFFSALTKSTPAPAEHPHGPDDPLLHMDIHEALFPARVSSPGGSRDPFSPASFKNLEMTAVALLTNFQNAYRSQSAALHALEAEREAQAEEREETETRTRHLKLQLENMARQALEREEDMKALTAALEKERTSDRGVLTPITPDTATVASEDLGAEDDQKRHRWSRSGAGLEDTDEESVGDAPSVFSRSRSPTHSTHLASGAGPAAASDAASSLQARSRSTTASTAPRLLPPSQPHQPQISAFQKLMKGFTGDADPPTRQTTSSCRNCEGVDSRAAWDTVGLLRDENRGLKNRVTELESCVEGALDAVNGLRLE